MLILDLFSGTKSVKKITDTLGWDYISLDNCKKFNPDICIDILKWDYKNSNLKPTIIWASPPCITWSIATHKHRTLPDLKPKTKEAKEAELLVKKTIEIIQWFKPKYYIIENPRGRLRHFPPIKKLPFRNTMYYGNYGAKVSKPTDFWTNYDLWKEEKPKSQLVKWSYMKGNRFINRNQIPSLLIFKLFTKLLENEFNQPVP